MKIKNDSKQKSTSWSHNCEEGAEMSNAVMKGAAEQRDTDGPCHQCIKWWISVIKERGAQFTVLHNSYKLWLTTWNQKWVKAIRSGHPNTFSPTKWLHFFDSHSVMLTPVQKLEQVDILVCSLFWRRMHMSSFCGVNYSWSFTYS